MREKKGEKEAITQHTPVYPSNVTISPGTQEGGGSNISTFSGALAHITIASDTTPRILVCVCMRVCVFMCVCERDRPLSLDRFEVAENDDETVVHALNIHVSHKSTAHSPRLLIPQINYKHTHTPHIHTYTSETW